MSDEECITVDTSDAQLLTADYKDGQLQIVEMTPYERDKGTSILPEITDDGDSNKYLQVVNSDKGLVQLDLLNLTLVRCEDGTESYRLVPSSGSGDDMNDTVTCVMHADDADDKNEESYMMVEGSDSLVLVQRSDHQNDDHGGSEQQTLVVTAGDPPDPPPRPTPVQLLAKAKALQRAKALLSLGTVRRGVRGRRARTGGPTPTDIRASPNFKLYLYYCKLCPYKCNAIKDLQAHKAECHIPTRGAGRGGRYHSGVTRSYASSAPDTAPDTAPTASGSRQCTKCPNGTHTQKQLLKNKGNVKAAKETVPHRVSLSSREVELADVLVCGACGYESADRNAFRTHIENEHGALTV